MWGRGAVAGEATIVDKRAKSTSGDALVTIYEYVADIRVPGEQPYRCVLQEPHFATNFWSPDVGAVVRVHAYPAKQTASFDKDDPQLNARRRLHAEKDRFDDSARGIPGSPPAPRDPLY